MKLSSLILTSLAFLTFSSCGIYKSPDRKKFEEDHVASAVVSTNFNSATQAASFSATHLTSCSSQSAAAQAEITREISTYESADMSSFYILRQHLIHGQWIYETDNTNGVYCLYE